MTLKEFFGESTSNPFVLTPIGITIRIPRNIKPDWGVIADEAMKYYKGKEYKIDEITEVIEESDSETIVYSCPFC